MSEPGFEVASAFIRVSPDTSDFPSALDEQLGGLGLSVALTPNTSDFESMLDDQLGGLTISAVVTPDASDFAAALDEQIGGLSVTAQVTPDATDFAAAFEEQAGSLTARVSLSPEAGAANLSDAINEQAGTIALPVVPVPEVSGFEEMLTERIGGLSVPVGVYPNVDAGDFQDRLDEQVGTPVVGVDVQASVENLAEHFADSLAGAIPVPVVPDVSLFTDKLDEELAGLTASVQVVPDVTDFSASLEDLVGTDQLTLPVSVDTSAAVDSLDSLTGAEQGAAAAGADLTATLPLEALTAAGSAAGDAASGASELSGSYAALQDQFDGLQGRLSSLDAGFSALGASGGATDGEMMLLGDRMDSLNASFAMVGGEVTALGGELTAAGGQASGAAGEFQLVSSMVGELEGNLSAAEGAVASVGTNFDQLGTIAENAQQRLADGAGAIEAIGEAAPAAAEGASGLSGVMDQLAGRMSYFAVDPFMWMYAAPVVFEGVTVAAKALTSGVDGLVTSLAAADDARGLNVAGYQELAGQLGRASQALDAESKSEQGAINIRGLAGQAAHELAAESGALTASQQQELTAADNLTGHLGTLESQYGLTQQQAVALADAAGVNTNALSENNAAAAAAMKAIEAYATANLNGTGAVNQMAVDMLTFGDDALTASTRVSALDDAYNSLVGNFVSTQQDELQVSADLLTIASNATQAGASMTGTNQASVTLQQSFYSTIGAIEQTANAMTNAKDPISEVTGYIGDQITKLEGLTGGSAQAQQAVQGLKQWEDNLTESTGNVYGAINKAADALASNFSKDLEQAGLDSQQAKTDVDNLTTSILNNGAQSQSAQADRAQLIKDLEAAGVNASTAKTDVDNFVTSLGKIPKQVELQIIEQATGTISITGTAASSAAQQSMAAMLSPTGHAGGGLVKGGSGRPRADDIPALLSHGEYVVSAGAVAKYGTGFLDSVNAQHFAGGGYTGDLTGLGAWTQNQYTGLVNSLAASLEAALQANMTSAGATGMKPPVVVQFFGTTAPGPEQMHAITTQLSAAVGVS